MEVYGDVYQWACCLWEGLCPLLKGQGTAPLGIDDYWHVAFFIFPMLSYISPSFCLSVPALSCPFPPLYRKKRRKKTKGINLEKEKKKEKKAYSLPSLRGLGITCTGGTRCAEPSFQLRSAIPVTGVLAVGRVVENRFCTRGPNLRLDYWGGNIQIPVPLQANEPSQLPAKTGFKFNFKNRTQPAG